MMKKAIGMVLSVLAILACAAEEIVPAGTYPNLLQNGKLEILAGNFPGPWGINAGRCTFIPGSAPGGGGILMIKKSKSAVIIRQDWCFSLTENHKYRLSAKVRTSADFKAQSPVLMIFNNGWNKEARVPIVQDGTTGWRTVSGIITAPASRGGLYSAAIFVAKVESGTIEFADIVLESATAAAQEAQTAWLKDVPLRKLHIFGIHKGIFCPENGALSGRWYGAKTDKIEFAFDGKAFSSVEPDKNGNFTLPAEKFTEGRHILKIRISGKEFEQNFTVLPRPEQKEKRLNNLNVRIAELKTAPGQKATFVLDRETPVLFRMDPQNMTLTVDGGKRVLKNGEWIRLKEGTHTIACSAAGKVAVHRIADTVYYQLNHGPYLVGLPLNNMIFGRKNLMGSITVFFNPALNPGYFAKEIRPSGAIILNTWPMGDFKKFRPDHASLRGYDGVAVDEYSSTSPRSLAEQFTHRKTLPPHDMKVWIWETGSTEDSEIQAEVQSALCEGGDVLLSETYVKSNYKTESEAREAMETIFRNARNKLEKTHPGFTRNLALITSTGNVPLSFTTDSNPAVDYKYFLDMQFRIWANDPALRDLAGVGNWGGSYADRECNAWLAALFRHYVMEGNTEMLSKKYGFTFKPGILDNCDFADGLKGWTIKGKAEPGVSEGYCSVLKRFGGIPADAESCAVMEQGSTLSQSLKNLKNGTLYRIRMLTTGEVPAVALKGVQELAEKRNTFFTKKNPREKGTDIYFRAGDEPSEITLTADKGKVTVHYLSVTPCFEFTDTTAAEEKAETDARLAREVKTFAIRRDGKSGPMPWFENIKAAPADTISAEASHDGTNVTFVFRSPDAGTWEIHSAANNANGDLMLLSVDPKGTVRGESIVRERGGMPTKKIRPLADDFASASVSEANGIRTVTVKIPFANAKDYGLAPGKTAWMNFFFLGEKQIAGWNPTFKPERRLPWRLGRAFLGK